MEHMELGTAENIENERAKDKKKTGVWAIEEINSNYIEYSEGDHFAVVPGGVLVGGENEAGYVLYDNLFERWERPFQDEIVRVDKKEEIVQRIIEALAERGINCVRTD